MRRAYPQFLAAGGAAAAGRDSPGDLSADLLGRDPAERRRSTISIRTSIAALDRAGIDVRSGARVGRQRVGADADRAGDRPPAGAVGRHPPLHDGDADQPRDQHPARHAVLLASWSQQFGGTYYALASYNAGENRVVRWKAERPGMDEDEFIDDIPFPETQNYVKRILGTAEDYRRLYGGSSATAASTLVAGEQAPATSSD